MKNVKPILHQVELAGLKFVEWIIQDSKLLPACFIELKQMNPHTNESWDFYLEVPYDIHPSYLKKVVKYLRNYPWTQELLESITPAFHDVLEKVRDDLPGDIQSFLKVNLQ